MRFGNSSHYFSMEGNLAQRKPLNAAAGEAFHALAARISGTVTIPIPLAGFSTAANSAVTICSKVTGPGRCAPLARLGSNSAGLYTGTSK